MDMCSVARRVQQVGQEDSGATRDPTLGSEAVIEEVGGGDIQVRHLGLSPY